MMGRQLVFGWATYLKGFYRDRWVPDDEPIDLSPVPLIRWESEYYDFRYWRRDSHFREEFLIKLRQMSVERERRWLTVRRQLPDGIAELSRFHEYNGRYPYEIWMGFEYNDSSYSGFTVEPKASMKDWEVRLFDFLFADNSSLVSFFENEQTNAC